MPRAHHTRWGSLTQDEKAAAAFLGFTATSWDNESGSEPQPASANKDWNDLTTCDEGDDDYMNIHSPRVCVCVRACVRACVCVCAHVVCLISVLEMQIHPKRLL